ncbi:MAG: indole-3-glycerol-phosphate synthase [Acidimicrobiia bacterium]|nr:indole-3-glycerol-phosphate synthase [Acidimicrobiia bacterium]MYC58527.1 indole-3-glycerol-phosphate synthase [Acidimicrobiia bacterium]MYG94285.1 indole-3-glycerol-phosphate synthase [Acidimicrobiia bacterium]MYI30367.1 indole-3-glycerol-phosphate synthase [Acidimicrobiia bacterium]
MPVKQFQHEPEEQTKSFKQALLNNLNNNNSSSIAIIAEIKRRSPSRGDLNAELNPAHIAVAYRDGGASCLSVLTNQTMFSGSIDDLKQAAQASGLPVLRKDFITTTQDVYDSQQMGAAAVLLIVADLLLPTHKGPDLAELHHLALTLGMDALVEVKSSRELEVALAAGAQIIGVNQRAKPKSQTYTMDFQRAERMASLLPDHVVKVAESGIAVTGGTSIATIRQAGYHAALIGEALVTAEDPAMRLRELLAQD